MPEDFVSNEKKGFVSILQEFSIPLILGVVAAVIAANVDEHWYHEVVEAEIFGHGAELFGHHLTFHFLINDIFMVFFFGIAAKEITESVLPGGALNPPSKAVNPLFATLGGVFGPIGVFFLLCAVFYSGSPEAETVRNGWGIPTATDIALAWLVARMVFGNSHPAVNFLLLLAIADDAIGLIIIAVFYPDPLHPVHVEYMLITVAAMGMAFGMRKFGVDKWWPYILIAGTASWIGFINASLHPALALVPIVPFLPGPKRDTGMFAELDEVAEVDAHAGDHDSPLHNFEHALKLPVDFGLFFFGFANAGVAMASVNEVTWIILASLIVGKMFGVTFFAWLATKIGFPYPTGMGTKHAVVAGVVAGIGLTVALFVAGEAYPHVPDVSIDPAMFQGPAKMGALLSAGAAAIALIMGKMLNTKELIKDE